MKNLTFRARALVLAAAVLACLASTAHAGIFTFTGDTTGGPTFNRPLEDLSAPSVVGTAVHYNVFNFSVTVDGSYTFLTTGTFDTFGFLYAGTFDPTASLTNAVKGNDDLLGLTTSGFAHDLTAGTNYVYVTTGFGNTDEGVFSNTFGGPGDVVGAPGPPAASGIVTTTGNTAGGPTFNRLLEDLSAPSVVGTAVQYDLFPFSVTVGGSYSFLNTSAFDGFMFLYEGGFDPTTPLTNAVRGNDDLLGLTTSGFAHDLTAGTTYVLVSSGFGNTDSGAFSNTIAGPGALVTDVHTVPEPATLALLLGGVASAAWRARRRA